MDQSECGKSEVMDEVEDSAKREDLHEECEDSELDEEEFYYGFFIFFCFFFLTLNLFILFNFKSFYIFSSFL